MLREGSSYAQLRYLAQGIPLSMSKDDLSEKQDDRFSYHVW
jgi:hypothetical protein